jgi:hypothetical protein
MSPIWIKITWNYDHDHDHHDHHHPHPPSFLIRLTQSNFMGSCTGFPVITKPRIALPQESCRSNHLILEPTRSEPGAWVPCVMMCYVHLVPMNEHPKQTKHGVTSNMMQHETMIHKVSHTESEIIMCVFFSESTVALSTPPCAKNKYTRWTFRSIQLSTSFNQYNDIICITYYIAIVCRWTC